MGSSSIKTIKSVCITFPCTIGVLSKTALNDVIRTGRCTFIVCNFTDTDVAPIRKIVKYSNRLCIYFCLEAKNVMISVQLVISHHQTAVTFSPTASLKAMPITKGISILTDGYISKSIFFFIALMFSYTNCKYMKKTNKQNQCLALSCIIYK